MAKILEIASVDYHFTSFHVPFIRHLMNCGHEVHVACNFSSKREVLTGLGVKCHQVDFSRSPYSPMILKAYNQLKGLMATEQFDLVHTHTPTASFLGRYAAKTAGGAVTVYSVHGFHFFKGAPLLNWLMYYSMERLAARWTDCMITTNTEDYDLARWKFRVIPRIRYVPGVGIDLDSYQPKRAIGSEEARKKLSISDGALVLFCVGELNRNKNHIQAIKSLKAVVATRPDVILFIAGEGPMQRELRGLVELMGLDSHVKLLGHIDNVQEYLEVADIFIHLSFREGLPKSIMEAMATGLPIVATDIRGNRDLVLNEQNGLLVEVGDVQATQDAILRIAQDFDLRKRFSEKALERIMTFSQDRVMHEMESVFSEYISLTL